MRDDVTIMHVAAVDSRTSFVGFYLKGDIHERVDEVVS